MQKGKTQKEKTLMAGVFTRLFTVMLIGMMCSILCNVIDSAITGQFLGRDAVAAVGLTGPIISLIGLVNALFVAGTGQLCTESMGKADIGRVNQIFSTTVVSVMGFGCLMTAFFAGISPMFLPLIAKGADPQVMKMAEDYLRGYSFIIIPMSLSSLLNSLFALDNDQKRSMGFALIILVGDVALDLLNVFVFHGGLLGMALASVIGAVIGLFYLLLHFRKEGHLLRFSLNNLNFGVIPRVLVYGLAGAVPMLMGSIKTGSFNYVLLKAGGTDAIAAYSAAGGAFILLLSLTTTIQSTTATLTGLAFGEENTDSISEVLRISLVFSYRIYLVIGAILFALAGPVSSIFLRTDVVSLRQLAISFVRFMVFQNLFVIATYALSGSFAGTGHIRLNYLVSIFRDGLFPCLLVLILGLTFGLQGVQASLPASGLLTLFGCICIPAVINRRFPRSVRDLLILPKDFGPKPGECFEASAKDMDQVVEMSEKARQFCLKRGEDQKMANHVALFIEEMAKNTVQYGFEKVRNGRIELRLILRDQKKIIRIKDNGRPFDPLRWLEENNPKDPGKNMGIRMLVALAKKVYYIPGMELNNIIVEL
ncbi:MAG: ATP-binding protein [Clostridia bacterium]|nr:ATP-binding protein [Clostridia bacterium]